MTTIAIIPARGGSKRIPRKNIRTFCGKPMIGYSIITALSSGCFSRVVVSTDDQEIADIAISFGAEIPFLRPKAIADDHTATVPVITHAIQNLSIDSDAPTEVCCLYATAPFTQKSDVKHGLEILRNSDASYVVPMTSYPYPIQRAVRLRTDNRMELITPQYCQSRSQDLEPVYHDAGQFYWGRADAWLREVPLIGPETAPIILPTYRVQDIDTLEDWRRAENLYRILRAEGESLA